MDLKKIKIPMHSTGAVVLLGIILSLASNTPFLLGLPRDHFLNWVMVSITAFLFFVVAPVLIIKKIYRKPLSEYGFRWPGFSKRQIIVMTVATLITFAQIPLVLKSDAIRQFYLLPEQPLYLTLIFIGPLALIYYLSEEFLFRGFLNFAIYKNIGWRAIIVIAGLFGILHMGKPAEEILWAVGFSVLFSWVALETKSFLPAALLHFLLAFAISIIINIFSPGIGPGSFMF